MPRYLSPEWFAAAQEALSASDAFREPPSMVELVVQQVVTGTPDGDVTYHVDIGHRGVQMAMGAARAPTVTFIQSWDTASGVARGELSAQGAFMSGLIRVRGDLQKLIDANDVFARVGDVLAELRANTQY